MPHYLLNVTENKSSLECFLDEQANHYNSISFIDNDPVFIPHQFSKKEDIEISGFFAATLAWGIRKSIINSSTKLMQLMDLAPHDFILNATAREYKPFQKFVHRTFNGIDCINFMTSLQHIYKNHGGLEAVFTHSVNAVPFRAKLITTDPFQHPLANAIHQFRKIFFEANPGTRTQKHIADPLANSSAKRICMYLRWMVRNDSRGVDFGLWKNISPALLCCPLDLHSGRVARELGLLSRKQNDWKAVIALTENLRKLDPLDPVKYDFALFGMGVGGRI